MGRLLSAPSVATVCLPLGLAWLSGCQSPAPPRDVEDLMSVELDLAASREDLGTGGDQGPTPDLAAVPDLASPADLATAQDLSAGPDGCGDTSSDPRNCGACGNRCAEGRICCGGACRDPLSDPAHCRSCGHSCGGNACCGGLCTSLNTPRNCGACGSSCAEGQSCCAGACTDTQRDPSHCGGCGLRCAPGRVCAAGGCYAADGGLPDMSGPGCLAGGRAPPAVCFADRDPLSGTPYTICRADCTSAWVSHAEPAGGRFAFQTICQQLGYSRAAQWGGTCGEVCGYCEGRRNSCMRTGNEHYDGGGMCGPDCLQVTVMWQCVK